MKNKYISSYSPKYVTNKPSAYDDVVDTRPITVVLEEWTALSAELELLAQAIRETRIGLGFLDGDGSSKMILKRIENLASQRGKHYDCWRTLWGTYLAKRLTR